MATYTSICEFRAVQLDNMHSNEATLIKAYNTVCGFYFHIKNQKSCIAMSSPPAKDHYAANQCFKHSNRAFVTLNGITMVSLHLL